MKTLYVSDLDGTLLRSDEKISGYTCSVINSLTESGMVFSYATARSLITARKVTEGLTAKIPLIIYNGAFIVDNVTGDIIRANYFDASAEDLLDRLFDADIYPIVYSYIDGREKFSYVQDLCTPGMKTFTGSRSGDARANTVNDPEELKIGDKFYITCIDEPDKLRPIYEEFKDIYHCVYQKDIYTHDQWLEIMPKEASKANAVGQLKEMLGIDKVIAFGDGRNDIDLFDIADEGYAVENADSELKAKATGIIRSNDEDGVARWLDDNAGVKLVAATEDDIETIWKMQVEAFAGLLMKYQDHAVNPAAESVDRVRQRFIQEGSTYYYIVAGGENVGVIRIIDKGGGTRKRVSPLWIGPKFRRMGYAYMAMKEAEKIYGSHNWSLDTILQEEGNIRLYEKLGYRRSGDPRKINDKIDIVFFEKD